MTLLTVIPARLGSTRLSRKPLRLLGGVPLVVRVFERVASHAVGETIVVATDHEDVIAVCRQFGVPAVMTAITHASGTDRVFEVASRPEFAHCTAILNVQGDEPFISRDALDGAVSPVIHGRAEIGTVAARASADILQRADVVKVVRTDDGRALYFSRAPIPFVRESADAELQLTLVRQHLGVYAYTREALARWVALPPHPLELVERLEQLRPLANGMSIAVADVAEAPESGIDTADDLARANARWSTHLANRSRVASFIPIPSTT